MPNPVWSLAALVGFSLTVVGNATTQQPNPDPLRMTLAQLRKFAVYARVQMPRGATLQHINEGLLRLRIERVLRREGIMIETHSTVRDGSQASLDLLYVVMETRGQSGQPSGFAASSCLQTSQMVRIPRLTTPKRIAYAVVPTWRSCSLLVGNTASFVSSVLQSADEHLTQFVEAWRMVNVPDPPPSYPPTPDLGLTKWTSQVQRLD